MGGAHPERSTARVSHGYGRQVLTSGIASPTLCELLCHLRGYGSLSPVGPAAIRIALQSLLFVVAIAVFFFGTGVGLQVNPGLGTLLWAVAAAIAAVNVIWISRSRT